MDTEAQRIQLMVQILEHLLASRTGQPVDPISRVACISAYAQLCSLNPDEPVDHYINAPSTGALYKIHLPANPEGFLSQLILPIIVQRDSAGLCALLSTLNGRLQDSAVHPRVKLSILNVENSLLRHSIVTDLPVEQLAIGRDFCSIRRALVLDAMDNPPRYFRAEDAMLNESVLHVLYGLYVDAERDLCLRVGQRDAIMPFYDDALTATRHRKRVLARIFRSAIAANQRAALITVEAMREKLDQYGGSLDGDDMNQLERMIEYYDGGQDEVEIRSMTIQLASATFRGTDPSEIYTVMQFVLPLELKASVPEVKKWGNLPSGPFEIVFRRIQSVYEDPMMTFLANIGSEKIDGLGLPSSFLSDVNPETGASSALVLLKLGGLVALDFDVTDDGGIAEKAFEDARAIRGGQFFPHKEMSVGLLRTLYREAPDQFPLKCRLDDLHIDAFSNYLVDYRYRLKDVGDILVYQKSYLLTRRDAFVQARMRYADKIGELYRQDEQVNIKALLDNSVIRTNESLRNFVYKVLKLTVKECIERHSCWGYLWEENPRQPKLETDIHPFIDSHLRTVLELKGVRVSREPRMANGAVDFFCSFTTRRDDVLKVCIEVKNAHAAGLMSGVSKQLPAYMSGEHTTHGIYLVMWYKGADWSKPDGFGSIGELTSALEARRPKDDMTIDLMIVNCTKPVPPSKK